jgi:hypothetical protein
MTDHYGDAIAAGAAALAKPYREPETIRAFTDEYPTLAAARVLDAALPHMRAAIIAEGITPGPCPATKDFGHEGIFAAGNPKPRTLRALCDLRAGHAGQHEAEDEQWGNFRWTDEPPTDTDIQTDTRCGNMPQRTNGDLLVCDRTSGHPGWHIAGTKVWDGIGEIVLT